jgi:ABC-type sulfate transport system permease subunit
MADVPSGDTAKYPLGAAIRRAVVQRAGEGEFGAVAVVSGHIRGQTLTVPLYVEALFNDYDWVGAFSVVALLSLLALVTLGLRFGLDRQMGGNRREIF